MNPEKLAESEMHGETPSGKTAIRTVHSDVTMSLGQVSLVSDLIPTAYDRSERTPQHVLQLSLLPYRDNGRGCFPEVWGRNRFEPIGPLFLLPAEQVIHARSDCPEQRAIVYTFADRALERWFKGEIDWSAARLQRSLTIADPAIRQLMIGIGQELRSPGFASETLIELMAAQVVIALSRQLRNAETFGAGGGLAPWRLRLIDDYLAQHPAQSSLTAIAAECRLSVRQLSRAFKASRGCSIGAYIAQSRIEYAQRRLALGVTAKIVAEETGFSSTSNFFAAFRRATGQAPGDAYRLGTSRLGSSH